MVLINRTQASAMLETTVPAMNALIYNYRKIPFPKHAGTEKNKNSTTKLFEDIEIIDWYCKARDAQRLANSKPTKGIDLSLATQFLRNIPLSMRTLAVKHGSRGQSETVSVGEPL